MLLESLYNPTRKDRLTGLAQRRWIEQMSGSAAIATVNATGSVVPPDTIRIVNSISAYVSTGGGFTLNFLNVDLIPSGSGILVATFALPFVTGGNFTLQTVNGPFVMFAGEYLFATGNWAGAAAHSIRLGLVGYEIPRANVQR